MINSKLIIMVSGFLVGLGQTAMALESLGDAALSGVNARDGITLDMKTGNGGITAQQLNIDLEDGGDPDMASSLRLSPSVDGSVDGLPITLVNVDENGNMGGMAHVTQKMDVGSDGSMPYLSYQLDIHGEPDADGGQRARLALGELSHGGDNAYGSWALDGSGRFHLVNRGGLFNNATGSAYLLGELNNGRIYYRQLNGNASERAYMIMDNLRARWEMAQGTLGINNEGIRMATANEINVALDTDLFFKTGGADFTPGGRGLQHFGWLGNLKEAELLWRTQGAAGTDTPGVLNLASRWNFVSAAEAGSYQEEFRWRLGETGGTADPQAGDTRVMFEVADWDTWGGHDYGHDFPLIALDTIAGDRIGNTENQLCWGAPGDDGCGTGELVNLTPGHVSGMPDNEGIALFVRDGNLLSYSRRINLIEQEWVAGSGYQTKTSTGGPYGDPDVTASIDWGLIYTFADVNGNVYLYPGGNPANNSKGIMADILLMSQTFDQNDATIQGFNWDTGSHLMIADTNMDGTSGVGATRNAMGIGLIGTSFMLMADNARLWLKPRDGSDYYSGGLDIFSPRARFALNTTFGGGVLPDNSGDYGTGPRFVLGSVISGNLEGAVNMRLSPSAPAASGDPKNYLGYSWGLKLKGISDGAGADGFGGSPYGSYISLAEPSNPDVAIRLAEVTGNIALTNGKIDVQATGEGGDNRPSLTISHTMHLGNDATSELNERLPGVDAGAKPELKIDNIMLGEASLGRIVMPSGRAHASIKLEPQQAAIP